MGPLMHPADFDEQRLMSECRLNLTKRKGPGGQNRNKVETAVVIEHLPSGITAEANEKRSQAANRKTALFRLRVQLALRLRSERLNDNSSLLAKRIRSGKIAVNPEHEDFPALLAEVLDRLNGNEFDLSTTAEGIGISASQILRFLRLHPPAFELFNQERTRRGLPRLKYR